MAEAKTVRLAPRCLGRQKLLAGNRGDTVLPRDRKDFLPEFGFVGLQALGNHLSHHRRVKVGVVFIPDQRQNRHDDSPFRTERSASVPHEAVPASR